MSDERTINFARTRSDVAYALALADRHKDSLGFLPRTIYQAVADADRLMIARANDDPVGLLMIGPLRTDTRIYQTCVQEDARRVYNGSDLLSLLVATATIARVHRLSLWCASDLPANAFWASAGYTLARTRIKSKRRGRLQNEWSLLLPDGVAYQRQLAADPRERTRDILAQLGGLTTASRLAIQKANWKHRR